MQKNSLFSSLFTASSKKVTFKLPSVTYVMLDLWKNNWASCRRTNAWLSCCQQLTQSPL